MFIEIAVSFLTSSVWSEMSAFRSTQKRSCSQALNYKHFAATRLAYETSEGRLKNTARLTENVANFIH